MAHAWDWRKQHLHNNRINDLIIYSTRETSQPDEIQACTEEHFHEINPSKKSSSDMVKMFINTHILIPPTYA